MLKLVNVSKKFGNRWAVRDISFDVQPGMVFGIIGPNGAGKTTTIRMMLGLLKPTSGRILMNDIDVANETQAGNARAHIGFLSENPGLYENLSAYKNLFYFAQLYGIEKKEIDERITAIMELLGIGERMHHRVKTFSKGMKQKIAIARAIIHEPEYLLLDEPTASLDPSSAKTVREFILNLRNSKRGIVLATHNLHEAQELCDNILVLNTVNLGMGKPGELVSKLFSQCTAVSVGYVSRDAIEKIKAGFGDKFISYTQDKLMFAVQNPEHENPKIIQFLVENNIEVRYVEKENRTLEDVYIKLVRQNEAK